MASISDILRHNPTQLALSSSQILSKHSTANFVHQRKYAKKGGGGGPGCGGAGGGGVCKSKIAIVTGSARGIGFAIAESLLKSGAKVALTAVILSDRLVNECDEAAHKLTKIYGEGRVLHQTCDVTKKADMEKLFKCTKKEFNQLDIVVNNAGILADERWYETILINAAGTVHGTFLAFKHMGKHEGGKGGTVINVASIVGQQPLPGAPVYCATKHFVNGFTRSIGSEYFYKLSNVKVMSIGPGVTSTTMIHDSDAGASKNFGNLAKLLAEGLGSLPSQPPECVGECVIEMLKDGTNGSVWISEDHECYKCNIPERQSYKGDIICMPGEPGAMSDQKEAGDCDDGSDGGGSKKEECFPQSKKGNKGNKNKSGNKSKSSNKSKGSNKNKKKKK